MFDTITSRARPTAASHAANTNRIMGIINDSEKWRFRVKIEHNTNIDNIMPSKHNSDDIRWDR